MKLILEYESDDGRRFSSKESCRRHEKQCEYTKESNDMLKQGRPLYDVMEHVNWDYPNWNKNLSEKQIELLKRITTNAKFVVAHWQCRDNPGYRVCEINTEGRIYLFGDTGSWSGPYGNWITLSELLRYSENPNTIF